MRALNIAHNLSNDQLGNLSRRSSFASKALLSKSYDEINSDIAVIIERDKSGSIDYDYYENRAKSLRSKAVIEAITSFCLFIWSPFFK